MIDVFVEVFNLLLRFFANFKVLLYTLKDIIFLKKYDRILLKSYKSFCTFNFFYILLKLLVKYAISCKLV